MACEKLQAAKCRNRLTRVAGAGGLAFAAIYWADPLIAQKLATDLVLPVGLILGLLLAVAGWLSLRARRQETFALVSIAVFYCVVGNQYVGCWLMRTLERPYLSVRPFEGEPFDVVIVLGGGTNTGPRGRAQVSSPSGDRVLMAARLYHQHRTRKIICTGETVAGISPDNSQGPAAETVEILTDLGIERNDLVPFLGRTTSEEMQHLSHDVTLSELRGRVGLITSAWHLPRAMRLAADAGLVVEPIPCDFQSIEYPWSARYLLPNPDGVRMTYWSLREYLAYLVGR